MAKAIPELGLCVFLENPGQDGNFCTWPDCVSLLFDYDFVGRSRFRSKVPWLQSSEGGTPRPSSRRWPPSS